MSEQGRKYDGGKLRYDLIPVLALEDMVKGLTFGTIKYDDNNWVKVPNGRKRYLAAALRHIQEYRKGNLRDEEQDIHHLSAAMNNLSFIVEKDLQGWGDVSETPEIDKAEKVIVMPPHYQNPDNDEDKEVRDFYITRAKGSGVAVAFDSKENVYKESESGDQSDISQEELKIYIDSVVESEKEKLWYPPVEDGGNPWIEWHPTSCDIHPKGVSESTVVDVLMDYEREEEDFETSPQKARDWSWGDSSIVAYRVVKE